LKTRGIKYSHVETWLLFAPSQNFWLRACKDGSAAEGSKVIGSLFRPRRFLWTAVSRLCADKQKRLLFNDFDTAKSSWIYKSIGHLTGHRGKKG